MRNRKKALCFILIGLCYNIFADSWNFFPGKREYKFGDIKIVQIVDAKGPTPNPDFIIDFYIGKKLQAKYRNIYAEAVFQSPDGNYFVGLSNSGLSGGLRDGACLYAQTRWRYGYWGALGKEPLGTVLVSMGGFRDRVSKIKIGNAIDH